MQAIIFAIISYIGWGTGDIFGTIATRKIGAYSTTFWFLVIQTALLICFAPFFINDLKNISPTLLLLTLFLGCIGTTGLIAFYEALRYSNASLVGTISASFAAVSVVLSVIFLKETVTYAQTISITVIFVGILISTLDLADLKGAGMFKNKGIVLSIAAMLLWGIYFTFLKIPVREIGWFWPVVISNLSLVVVLLYMKIRHVKLEKINDKSVLPALLANSILLGIGLLSFNYAISKGLVAVVAPIAGSYPSLFAILAFFAFHDPIKKREIIGIIVGLAGIVLLSINSV